MSSELLLDLPIGLFHSGFPSFSHILHAFYMFWQSPSPWIDNPNIFVTSTDNFYVLLLLPVFFSVLCFKLPTLQHHGSGFQTLWRSNDLAKTSSRPFRNFMCTKNSIRSHTLSAYNASPPTRMPAIVTEAFRGLPQSTYFLLRYFQFIIHYSSYHSTP
jgi:hypothetical protein